MRTRAAAFLIGGACVTTSCTPCLERQAELRRVAGDGQVGRPGERLAIPLQAALLTACPPHAGVGGQEFVWTASDGGTIEPASGVTDAQGMASASWVLPEGEGPRRVTLTIRVDDFPTSLYDVVTEFTATVRSAASSGCDRPLTLSDSFDVDGRWSRVVEATSAAFTDTAGLRPSGGNPGPFRAMTHFLPAAGEIYVFHEYVAGYDPRVSGAVTRLRYSEDRIQIAPPAAGAAIAGGFWIGQGGRRWTFPLGTGEFRSTSWENASVELRAADLPADLTAAGAPVRFGYYRANSTGGQPFTLTHGIDNWSVEVCR